MKSIFREYDIRGIFEKELNEDIVKKIGYFLGQKIDKEYVLVSYDARVHSPVLADWLISGFNKAGKKVVLGGILPTGVNYFGNFQKLCLDRIGSIEVGGGVQITGSHNPPEYNGFKITIDKKPFFGQDIYALGDEILNSDIEIEDNTSKIEYDLKSQYIDYIVNQFSHLQGLENNFVFDCGNGVAGVVLREILDKLKIKNYKILFEEPDGTFPNHHPDPSEEENLKDIVEINEDNSNISILVKDEELSEVFINSLHQVFQSIFYQKYVIEYQNSKDKKTINYFPVPDYFAKNKTMANIYKNYWNKYISKGELIYIKNEKNFNKVKEFISKRPIEISAKSRELWM